MKPTITMLLSEYEQIQEQLKERGVRLQRINRCLKLVHNVEIEDLLRTADGIEQSRAINATREAIMTGKF